MMIHNLTRLYLTTRIINTVVPAIIMNASRTAITALSAIMISTSLRIVCLAQRTFLLVIFCIALTSATAVSQNVIR